ncbi:uncharacterized protein LACBIDRAFT_306701 [Laccaria bicolor S238N-H82]|uniref:Predicted protein n=1 Tax=Laccaria bicolor (strain S238N-H82 / ATCC MYA-4686) TaxID=486041 RepID=B0DNK5_LACBS|nr:uncharacterized protein LACBIDRAFT_306701 [Laccaria bicolor S238N-H82]EDR03959.1 predicted protein [Laccaria bicolor S238N-H82]|eukprot:XP_001885527.1 predicted protein [Laccaria bicolor S238N-H82]
MHTTVFALTCSNAYTHRHLLLPPHCIRRHCKFEESMLILRSKIRCRKGHVECSKDRKTNGWR